MTKIESAPLKLKRLRERAGLSMDKAAKGIGLKGASSYQRYEDESLLKKPDIPLHIVRGLARLLVGRATAADHGG